MKTMILLVILVISASLFADESAEQMQMRWQMEEQTRIMQQQLKLQQNENKRLQMQQNSNAGAQNRANGGIDVSPMQNWLLNSQ